MAMPACWTTEMTEKGLEHWLAGRSYGFIAKELGVSSSVVFKYGKQVWPSREEKKSDAQWTEGDLDKLRQLVSEGKSVTELTEVFSRSDKAVRVKIEKLGLNKDYRTYGWTDEQDKILRERYNTVKSVEELVPILGKSLQTIVSRAFALKIRRNRADHLSPNFHGKSESLKRAWHNNQARRINVSQAMHKFWDGNDIQKQKHSVMAKELHLDPKYQAAMREVMKNGSSIERKLWKYLEIMGLKENTDWKRHFNIDYYSFDVVVYRAAPPSRF